MALGFNRQTDFFCKRIHCDVLSKRKLTVTNRWRAQFAEQIQLEKDGYLLPEWICSVPTCNYAGLDQPPTLPPPVFVAGAIIAESTPPTATVRVHGENGETRYDWSHRKAECVYYARRIRPSPKLHLPGKESKILF